MARPPDFIGLGAQKAGTSWLYACLYEHPEICMPIKEIHFFSRQRNWPKGYEWYESLFEKCPPETKTGEFCTSYLADPATPERICARYPAVKLIASLRNPVDRAFSNYLNDIMSGEVASDTPFLVAMRDHPEYVDQGRYATQLRRYLKFFARGQILVLFLQDIHRNPQRSIQQVYQFIGVDSSFTPSFLTTRVGVGRVPRSLWIYNLLKKSSSLLRQRGFHRVWWLVKKTGIGDKIRSLNTRRGTHGPPQLSPSERQLLYSMLQDEIMSLENLLGCELEEWYV